MPASKWNEQIASTICDRLALGQPLTQICKDITKEGYPLAGRTVRDWEAQRPEFGEQIARARALGEEAIIEECLTIADTPLIGEENEYDNAGNLVKTRKADMLGHRKLQVDTRLRFLAKFNPKRWGDKVQTEITGANGGPVETVTSIKLAELE